MGRPCGHTEYKIGCLVCYSFERQDNEAGSKCVHLGEKLQERKCGSCRSSRTVDMYVCSLHGKCTLEQLTTGARCCKGCPDKTFKKLEMPVMETFNHPLANDTEAFLNRIDALTHDLPSNWPAWPSAIEAHRQVFQSLAKKDWGQMPSSMKGRGIVTCAGGNKFFACAWVQISLLRHYGCSLPVEVWYNGRAEMDRHMQLLLESLSNVKIVDAQAVSKSLDKPPRTLNGWELKPFSILHSGFKEVLFLDADCLPARNPTHIFDDYSYQRTGAIFWPDLPPSDRKEWLPAVVWDNCGIPYRDEVDFESGQMLINKEKCWNAINLTMWCNEHSDYFYKFVYGDKSTFHLGWRGCGLDYGMPKACGWKSPAILQHGMDGKLLFMHCCRGKEMIANGQKMIRLPDFNLAIDAWRVLTTVWTGQIYDYLDQSYEEKKIASTVTGVYRYKRVIDPSDREMHLLSNGTIGLGAASCEKRWTVRIMDGVPTIVITGEAHKGTEIGMMFLNQCSDGVWRGNWEAHERCGVELRTCSDSNLPVWFNVRDDKWDRNIFNCVNKDNEYDLPASLPPNSVVLDLGAHIGSFSYACLTRNAYRVIAFEPDITNYLMLTRNLKHFNNRFDSYQMCVAGKPGKAVMSKTTASGEVGNTGGYRASFKEDGNIDAVTLDQIIEMVGEKKIRLIKLDIEGFEWEVLEAFKMVDRVEEIVGEFHLFEGGPELLEHKKQKLSKIMRDKGMEVEFLKETNPGRLGLFRIKHRNANKISDSN